MLMCANIGLFFLPLLLTILSIFVADGSVVCMSPDKVLDQIPATTKKHAQSKIAPSQALHITSLDLWAYDSRMHALLVH